MATESIEKWVRSEVLVLDAYVAGKSPAPRHGRRVKLASNENLAIDGRDVVRYLRQALGTPLCFYPDVHQREVKEAAVDFFREWGCVLSPEQVVFGDGSGESLDQVMGTFIGYGDGVVIPEKSFSLYRTRALLQGAKVIEVARRDFWVDLDALAESTRQHKAKMIIFSNPDNPTSTAYPLPEIERFLSLLPRDVLVLLDEAYVHFASWGKSCVQLLEHYPNLIVMQTLSKAFGLAALRVGFTVSHPALASQIEKIRLPFNLGFLAQKGAAYRLTHPKPMWKSVKIIQRQRKELITFLEQRGFSPLVAEGNFVFCDFGTKYEKILSFLESRGITVRSLKSFGFEARHVRITVGNSWDMSYFRKVFTRALEAVS